jgi:hypothetical protein
LNAPLFPSPLPSPALAVRRGWARALRQDELPRVADMFQRVFRKRRSPASPALTEELHALFLEHPGADPDVGSLVYERADGEIGGFLGVLPARLQFNGRPIVASVMSSWMVEDRERDAAAGATLLRAHLARGHDLTLTDTANGTSVDVLHRLRLGLSPCHSLQWVKALNYAAYGAAALRERLGAWAPQRLVTSARRAENLARRRLGLNGLDAHPGWRRETVAPARFGEGLNALAAADRQLAPCWSAAEYDWMLARAAQRPSLGALQLRHVFDARGRLAGAYAYHAQPASRAVALTIVARRLSEEGVLRMLIADARDAGCTHICGAADPALMDGLYLIPKVFYRHSCAMALKARTPEILAAATTAQGCIGGLVGDGWTPLATEDFG